MRKRVLSPLVGPLIFICVWIFLNQTHLISYMFLPDLKGVMGDIGLFFVTSSGVVHVGATLFRAIISLLIASCIGIPIGLFLGLNDSAYKSSEILIDFFRSVPGTAFFPLFLLFFGVGDAAKIGMTSFVIFWIILINSIYGVWNCSKTRLKVAKIFKLTNRQIIKDVIFFDALPNIVVGLKIGLSLALVITIIAEMFFGGNYGLGKKIYDSYVSYDTSSLFAIILIVGIVGFITNKCFSFIEKRTVHWGGK